MSKDVVQTVKNKYGIDLNKIKLLQLYGIESADISEEELQKKISIRHEKWIRSVSGTNERLKKRDQEYLDQEQTFISILNDRKLLKEIFDYYNQSTDNVDGPMNDGSGDLEFAEDFFKLVSSTKKLDKDDEKFFFEYYKEEINNTNKRAIREKLESQYPSLTKQGLEGKDDVFSEETEENDSKKRKPNGKRIQTLFSSHTIKRIHEAVRIFEKACNNQELVNIYANFQKRDPVKFMPLRGSLYEYSGICKYSDVISYEKDIREIKEEIYREYQEQGQVYTPLVNLWNILGEICDYDDIKNNFNEFKLLLCYPKLSPYMYSFYKMKPDTTKDLYQKARQEYSFSSFKEFLENYYMVIYKNFNIDNYYINDILTDTLNTSNRKIFTSKINQILGIDKGTRWPVGAEIIFWLSYFPVLIIFLLFELFKTISVGISHHYKITTAVCFGAFFALYMHLGTFGGLAFDFGEIIWNLALFIFLEISIPILAGSFLYEVCEELNKREDWNGIERMFTEIFHNARMVTSTEGTEKFFPLLLKKLPSIIVNVLCVSLLFIFL